MRQWIASLVLVPCLHGASFAQGSYPDRPITLIVTAAAGGVTDVAARALGQELTKAWGDPDRKREVSWPLHLRVGSVPGHV